MRYLLHEADRCLSNFGTSGFCVFDCSDDPVIETPLEVSEIHQYPIPKALALSTSTI